MTGRNLDVWNSWGIPCYNYTVGAKKAKQRNERIPVGVGERNDDFVTSHDKWMFPVKKVNRKQTWPGTKRFYLFGAGKLPQ